MHLLNLARLSTSVHLNTYKEAVLRKSCRKLSVYSRLNATAPSTGTLIKETESEIRVEEVPPVQLKPSFGKQLFIGKFDTDVLTFPEVLKREDHDTLHQMVHLVERYFEEKVDSKKIDVDAKIPEDVLQGVKDLGLFGQQIPVHLGGLGLNATGYARVAEAVSDGSVQVTLAAHQAIGLKGLLLYGTEEQQKKYLPRLASGEMIAAFCLTEPGAGSDAASVKTSAKLSEDGKHWILNGSKLWISNGGIADFFTVFASTDSSVDTSSSKRMTAFAVERKFGGVTSGKPEDKLGIRGSNTCEVHFDSTPVPIENVIGGTGNGFKVAVTILNSGRFSMGSAGAGMLRKLIKVTTEHAIQRQQFGKSLSEFGLIKEKIAQVTLNAYIMESMAYLTAGMLDSNTYEDCSVEAAIVKIFSSEACWKGASECLQIFGGLGYMKDFPFERLLRDARILLIFEGTNEILRLFVALMGIQTAGKELRDLVKRLRNPFKYPTLIMSKTMDRWRQSRGAPKLKLGLDEFLHPSFKDGAISLETSVFRLQYIVEILLQRHGAKITDAQQDLQRVANVVIDIYIMTAVLSRASRSYCTGIKNAHDELIMARLITTEAFERVRKNIAQLESGLYSNTDYQYLHVADRVIESKGYHIEHPLVRNIWRCVEYTFGILVGRWRILRGSLPLKAQNADRVILACVVLHNFMMSKSTTSTLYYPAGYGDYEDYLGNSEWKKGDVRNSIF